jgi:hypothetical protein
MSVHVEPVVIQAAISLRPSTNLIPSITSAICSFPLSRRQCLSAHCASLKTIVKQAVRLPQPFVRAVLNRTVAKVDSIGLVVRRCTQCSAGKS